MFVVLGQGGHTFEHMLGSDCACACKLEQRSRDIEIASVLWIENGII